MENEVKIAICKLCFNSCDNIFGNGETITTEMLGFLGLDLDLNTSGKPVICKTCSENLQNCFDFKTICLYTEDCINSFRDDRNNVNVDLREMYLRKNQNVVVPKYDTICRLCMEVTESGCFIALNGETKDTILETILRRCFSELDLGVTKDPIICTSCNASLHSYIRSIKIYLDMQDNIKKYEIEERSSKPQVKLEFGTENISDCKNAYTEINIRENCYKNEVCDEIKIKLENPVQGEIQDVRIKDEVNEYVEFDYTEAGGLNGALQFSTRNTLRCNSGYIDTSIAIKCYENEENWETQLKYENFEETESQEEFNIKHEEINLKTEDWNTARLEGNILIAKETSGIAIYQCSTCKFETKCKQTLQEHLILHDDVSEVVIQQHEEYDFKTKYEDNLDEYIPTHRNDSEVGMYQCAICVFETKQRPAFRQHMLIHKNACEVATYYCDTCTFETRYKHVLKLHALTHKNVSEVTAYSCGICTYKAKRKGHLKQHILSHKNTTEVTTYSCKICTYEAKRKGNLVQHMLTHDNSLEVAMYQCGVCTFKTRHKNVLKRHMLVHKNSSELPTFSCGICSYKAKQRGNLNRHMLVHKNDSEVTTYQCDICAFKTRHKNVLRRHMQIHTRT